MDFSYTPQEEAFRQEVRSWLDKNTKELPEWWYNPEVLGLEVDSPEYHEFALWWHKKLYSGGFVGLHWPKEYGGRGATLLEQVIFEEEMSTAKCPGVYNRFGVGWAGPTIMSYGNEEQKKRFLPKILSGEEFWCQCFSEPDAGSDLANIKTKAVEDADGFVVNGQKVWTGLAQYADWGILVVRTDPASTGHRGLSYLLVNMHSPGVTVRPLRQITGHSEFNEVFFDNVRIPKNLLVGERGKGWYVAMSTLEFERSGTHATMIRENTVKDMIKFAKETKRDGQQLSKDPLIRQKLAQFYIDVNILKYNGLRSLTGQLKGERPGPETMSGHLFGYELNQRMQDFAMQLQGPFGQLVRDSKYSIYHGEWQYNFFRSKGNTIETGTSEIKRNIIAQRGLGLPKPPRG
jgi:alkylation response protein AidB-like acyl-CoA dehydrogenase